MMAPTSTVASVSRPGCLWKPAALSASKEFRPCIWSYREMTMLSKSRYTATRGAPGSVTVPSYHLTSRLRADRKSSRFRDLAAGSASVELHDGPDSPGVTVGL